MMRLQQELKEVGDQIVFQQQDEFGCFNLIKKKMIEESYYNKSNLDATKFLLQKAMPNQSCDHPF